MSVLGRATIVPTELKMNGLERDYAAYLQVARLAGEIAEYSFEPEGLRLANRTVYWPDFRIVHLDGVVEFHEVKGHWREDARAKIKIAADIHPYVFRAVTRKSRRDGWKWETFTPGVLEWLADE